MNSKATELQLMILNLFAALGLFFGSIAWAESSLSADHVEVSAVVSKPLTAGPQTIGIRFRLEDEWHIYWKNPGDSGAAPKFKAEGATIQNILWPYPERIPLGELTNYGYSQQTVLFLESDVQQLPVRIQLEWLVCKVECIPGFGELVLNSENVQVDEKLFRDFLQRVPTQNEAEWTIDQVRVEPKAIHFNLNVPEGVTAEQIRNLFVFPEDGEKFLTDAARTEWAGQQIQVSVPVSANASTQENDKYNFTFVVEKSSGEKTAFALVAHSQSSLPEYLWALLFAFLGGLILNLMPCVFPVLFLKAFSFLKNPESVQVRRSGRLYTYGVLTTFLALGFLLALLRWSGESIGWGFQLQDSGFIFVLTTLFFVLTVHFLGFLDFDEWIPPALSSIGNKTWLSGDFGTGVLTVVVASPCTAPFMGSAIGYTLLISPVLSLGVFFCLGLGLAAPMLALSYWPGLAQKLPRSGPWMLKVKFALSVPMAATMIWLLWILYQQKGAFALGVSVAVMAVIAGLISIVNRRREFKWVGAALVALVTVATALSLSRIDQVDTPTSGNWHPYNAQVVKEKLKEQSVFIDFTASWCITCQLNKRRVLDTEEIQNLFKMNNVYLVRADWTNHNPEITAALASFGRNSVPLYVFHSSLDAQPILLSEILSKDDIKNLFNKRSQQ